jgi:4-hydroxybutyrate dehydrogenase
MKQYIWPGEVWFDKGAGAQTGAAALALGGSRVFVLADPGVAALGLLDPILNGLTAVNLPYTLCTDVVADPDVTAVDTTTAQFRASRADLIIGVGGGSALDQAKAVRLLAATPPGSTLADYLGILGDRARPLPLTRDLAPMIAIPTTAGTGSEVTPWGVITDPVSQRKSGVGGNNLLPDIAILDPALTYGLPPFLTAATGMDALCHLIEAFVSTNNHPALDPLILRGIELVGWRLPTAVSTPDHAQARHDMLEAAMLGGLAISTNWLGACHSLAHPLSPLAGVHHGLACAIMLPHQMAFSLEAAAERYGRIAAILSDNPQAPAAEAVTQVQTLLEATGLPTRLRDVGVTEEQIPRLAQAAHQDANWATNPCPLTEADMAALYEEAW